MWFYFYEWWSPRREAFDTAASRLEQLLHGELLGDLLGDLRFPARTISRLVSHDKRGTQRGGGRVLRVVKRRVRMIRSAKQKWIPAPALALNPYTGSRGRTSTARVRGARPQSLAWPGSRHKLISAFS